MTLKMLIAKFKFKDVWVKNKEMVQFQFHQPFNAVIPNQGAAANKGAVRRCQGCQQILKLLPFYKCFTDKGA